MNAPRAPAGTGAEAGDGGPVCIIPKNAAEQVRAGLSTYKGHQLVSLRLFWTPDDGTTWHPSKRGFALHVAALPELIEGLRRLEAEAKRRGWIEEGEGPHSTPQRHTRAKSDNHERER